jgi:hypothetical protein
MACVQGEDEMKVHNWRTSASSKAVKRRQHELADQRRPPFACGPAGCEHPKLREVAMRTGKKMTIGAALLGLLWVGACRLLGTHDEAFTEEGLTETNASALPGTIVTPTLESPMGAGKSVLWCASFQLAWNEACDLIGEDLHFDGNEPAVVAQLNQRSFTRQDLDDESCVAVAGFVMDGIFGKISQQLEATFAGRATPRYVPPRQLTLRPQDIVAYSYLFKNLEFAVPFERIPKPIVFGTAEVPCFGIGEEYKRQHYEMLEQLIIRDYQDADDFVVELKTKGKQDQLILAKVPPAGTLAETVRAVQTRAANADPTKPVVGDVLMVPKLNFDITRNYHELEGRQLKVTNPQIATDLLLLSAVQNIRFQLDEKGIRLRSESHLAFGCGGPPPRPATRHSMVFDKPFLIMLQRSDAEVPYFALWVENPELLVKVKK